MDASPQAENTIPEDDQEDETEQSLSDSLQTRRQSSRIHENVGHPSNRTLVRVLRLGGDKRRFSLAAVKHNGGVCEAQKHPAGPIVSRSPNSFVFNDFVGLDLFFLKHARKGLTTKIPWYHWSGRRLHCWWRRQSLGTGNFQAEETFHVRALGSGKGEIL